MSSLIGHLRRAALLAGGDRPRDGQLLESFLSRRDEAAFEALVHRHGPMVLGVCRRVLGNAHDAEDAFQATFLVLVRRAASLRTRSLVGNWLYGVAYRTAMKAKVMAARRQARERQAAQRTEPEVPADGLWQELLPHLDRELDRLPEKYRAAVVLCDLEGKGRKEAAGLLGIPEGTLSSRLATARKMLAGKLARHGPAVSGVVLGALLSENAASAAVPCTLAASTVKAALLTAAGGLSAAGSVSAPVLALSEGVVKTMLLAKLRIATAVAVVLTVIGLGAVGVLYPTQAAEPEAPKKAEEPRHVEAETKDRPAPSPGVAKGEVETINADKGLLTVRLGGGVWVLNLDNAVIKFDKGGEAKIVFDKGGEGRIKSGEAKIVMHVSPPANAARLENMPVAKDAKITVNGKPAKLADVKKGMRVALKLEVQGSIVVKSIEARD
jgi:RNA polymerase sigma factor (sigma-70 family)